jgi:type IV secretory pathway VirB9-like protein
MVAVNRVHTAWQIAVRKGAPPWAPLSVWDDGQRIVIRFAQALSYTFAPAVAAQGHNGQSVIIESTPWEDGIPEHGSYYLVSGLYPVLVLNDGQGNEVTLTRLTGQARGYQEVGNGTRR